MPTTASWVGSPRIKGESESTRMILLTFSVIGLQVCWGLEMTYCTPYLLKLGLTKSKTSLVWIAGPLSGLIMQPVIGIISDRSTSKYGRRRPFMVVGSIVVGVCFMVLGWTAELVGFFISDEELRKSATIAVAVLSIYAVDFAINAVQSCCRSLIVDTLPISKQQLGSAWASRMVSVGHLIGYGAGTIDLVSVLGKTFGDTQFKQLTVLSAFSLIIAVAVTSYAVEERVLIAGRGTDAKFGATKILAQLLKTGLNLPKRIQAICFIQFWAWIGWFPFLFYGSTWVGETYFRYEAPDALNYSKDILGDIGRMGSLSLVVFSIVSFVSSIVLPWLVRSPEEDPSSFRPRSTRRASGFRGRLFSQRPDLLTAWTIGQLMFAGSMILAPLVRSTIFATVLITVCAIPWVLSSWAPMTFLGVEINKLGPTPTPGTYQRLSTDSVELSPATPTSPSVLHLNQSLDHETSSSTGELAGVYLGILNFFTALPQFVGTFISMVVFAILEPGRSPELSGGELPKGGGVNAISVCLAIGALSTLVAAWACQRLRLIT